MIMSASTVAMTGCKSVVIVKPFSDAIGSSWSATSWARSARSTGSRFGHKLSGVGPRERKQHADQRRHPADIAIERAERLSVLHRRLGLGQREVDLAAHQREWRAQLVGGVAGELPLPSEGQFDPLEHRVERRGEPAEFVIGQVEVESGIEIVAVDLTRQPRDIRNRLECAAGSTDNR